MQLRGGEAVADGVEKVLREDLAGSNRGWKVLKKRDSIVYIGKLRLCSTLVKYTYSGYERKWFQGYGIVLAFWTRVMFSISGT